MPFRHYTRVRPQDSTSTTTYSPLDLAKLYQYPTLINPGSGMVIGVLELGGALPTAQQLTTYFQSLGVPVPNIVAVPVAGGNQSSDPNGANIEVALDVEIIGALCPNATIRVYFAPNTDAGFAAAIQQAATDGCAVLSISWGGPENEWQSSSIAAMETAIAACNQVGCTVCVASGDNGATDGESSDVTDYPASSPNVVACGGTYLPASNLSQETTWDDLANKGGASGGGVSAKWPLQSWENPALCPVNATTKESGHCVPTVALNASPESGYNIYVNGGYEVIGGTSAAAPMMAALIALYSQASGKKYGNLSPTLWGIYTGVAIRDITTGNNGGYSAGPGYDCCTGLGVPVGVMLGEVIGTGVNPAPPAPPAPTPSNNYNQFSMLPGPISSTMQAELGSASPIIPVSLFVTASDGNSPDDLSMEITLADEDGSLVIFAGGNSVPGGPSPIVRSDVSLHSRFLELLRKL